MSYELADLATALRRALRVIDTSEAALARGAGQSVARWRTLDLLVGGELTVPDIARRLQVTRQNSQHVVAALVNDGLVSTSPNPDHKTSELVRISPAGQVVLGGLNDERAQRMRAAYAQLEAAQLPGLERQLEALAASLQKASQSW